MINELDLRSLWKELDTYEKELDIETHSLQDVWVKIAALKASNEGDADQLKDCEEFHFVDPDTTICLNVGGQLFETTAEVLTRDPYSLLASICRVKPSISADTDGIFYFERDWWLFRHILSYLRSNTLPNELETLKELYQEANFYRLESLQKSIENVPVDKISNFSPQIATTWQGAVDGNRRQKDSHVLDESIFRNLS